MFLKYSKYGIQMGFIQWCMHCDAPHSQMILEAMSDDDVSDWKRHDGESMYNWFTLKISIIFNGIITCSFSIFNVCLFSFSSSVVAYNLQC